MHLMTRLMEQAIERLRAVPDSQQDQLASFMLNELNEDARWASTTAAHKDTLAKFAEQILADDKAGRCELLDPDNL
jgi:hypothetical protein